MCSFKFYHFIRFSLVFLVTLLFVHCDKNPVNPNSNAIQWTYLFYCDADFDGGYTPIDQFKSEAASSQAINVFVLEDTYDESSRLFTINKKHQIKNIEYIGEKNMGSAETLTNFIKQGKTKYPADRYILAFYNHGAGWLGNCIDETSEDMLTMDEIKQALLASGGVDIILNTAPCLMGAYESVYELRDCTTMYIGSENTSGYMWWYDTIKDIFDLINSQPSISCRKLSTSIINFVYENRTQWSHMSGFENLTMTAVDPKKLSASAILLDSLAISYMPEIDFLLEHLSFNTKWYRESIDLIWLLEQIAEFEESKIRKAFINIIINEVNEAIINECHGSNMQTSHGLSIFFSNNPLYNDPDYGLDFALDTKWDEFVLQFISAYLANKNKIENQRNFPILSSNFNLPYFPYSQ